MNKWIAAIIVGVTLLLGPCNESKSIVRWDLNSIFTIAEAA